MLTVIIIFLLIVGIVKAQTTKPDSVKVNKPIKDSTKTVSQLSDSLAYITNEDINGIYRYISDRTSGTQYFEIFVVLDKAIRETKKKAEDRYRKKKKD